jgi:hypothetical protein
VVLFFPTVKPVRLDNMNYAICVAAFIGLFSTVWWYAGARKTYIGPRTTGTSCHVSDACDPKLTLLDTIDMLPPEDPEDIFNDYDSV